ncbi:phosphatase PAP2 family protein [Luteolibacter luteus]|uniref:Phosphatase PAP2 family protein n=1 Tax=Luteolibacter luteus TaxID=2728835 RepID=A0A858RLJ4_9BACT|nr:phosphatase PAP2 family protein [Luteolibacter luteus]QJE97702.1 phosphatase PAP2 family protein [Luteolibacter luteus]
MPRSFPWLDRALVPLLVLLVLGGIGLFIEIALEVRENETRRLDESLLLMMREPGNPSDPIGSDRIEEMARDLTALGGLTLLTGVTLVATGVALFADRWRLALLGVASVLGGTLVMNLLKHGFDRPRPNLVEHHTVVHNASFPSGHSMMAAMVYLTLGILLARTQPRKRVRAFIVVISILITILVGVSRVYLGVHWPTDVVAGWALGGAWAVMFWLLAMKVDPQSPAK